MGYVSDVTMMNANLTSNMQNSNGRACKIFFRTNRETSALNDELSKSARISVGEKKINILASRCPTRGNVMGVTS